MEPTSRISWTQRCYSRLLRPLRLPPRERWPKDPATLEIPWRRVWRDVVCHARGGSSMHLRLRSQSQGTCTRHHSLALALGHEQQLFKTLESLFRRVDPFLLETGNLPLQQARTAHVSAVFNQNRMRSAH